MILNLFNTETQKIAPFQAKDETITIDVCSSAAGDSLPLNQVFTYCAADVLARYLQMKEHSVSLNLILRENGAATRAWLAESAAHLQTLNVHPPDNISLLADTQQTTMAADILVTTPQQHPDHMDTIRARFCLETAVPQNAELPITTLLKQYPVDALRLYLAQHHYRKAWTYDPIMVQKATTFVEKLKAAMNALNTGAQPINIAPAQRRFTAVMDNDLDTSKGIATMLNLADEILFRAPNGYQIDEAQTSLCRMASVFGLYLDDDPASEDKVMAGWDAFRQQLVENPA